MANIEVKVVGMTCGGCERSVVGALSRLGGVTEVTADHRTGVVHVESQADLDQDAVRSAVEDAGYEIVEVGQIPRNGDRIRGMPEGR